MIFEHWYLNVIFSKWHHQLAALLAVPAALLLSPGRAEALLTYTLFESGFNVVLEASGSLQLPASSVSFRCTSTGLVSENTLCTGPVPPSGVFLPGFTLTGPAGIPFVTSFFPGSSVTGVSTVLNSNPTSSTFAIDPANAGSINSTATFNNRTLASLGFTTPGLIGTWQVNGISGEAGQINLVVAPVPGPLPLLGAAAAMGWSRRLRQRIAASKRAQIS
ncbi:hypothetical protein KQ306_03920 [Synechococcus sp. CS-1324]|uniref:hypothetical protein n=1 Tax=Synechococcus sp. CS-1324 TaxID=2847980 RepID=UPI00223BC08F|nr:hypothetical protein [Synechococcus sp. CS-1324]MCT0230010.1 hypothetical protein [Synechococcus sp. CS-1324]